MPLMERMRGFTKVILYGLVLAFVGTIIFDWGMDFTGLKRKTGLIAEIDGEEIPVQRFSQLYENALDDYQQRTGGEITDAQREFILNQVWESLIRGTLEQQEIERLGLKATEQELAHYMIEDPPDFIKNLDSSFTTPDGQLNRARYNEALANPQNDPVWRRIEGFLRENLPREKLLDRIAASVYVTESEVYQEYLNRTQTATIEYLFFDPNRFNNVEVTVGEDEIRKYYKENKDKYKQPERRKIEYVLFSTRPTKKDTLAIEQRALELLERAKSGEDFATLAESYSEDIGSAASGGDLGYQKRGTWVKPFENAAFNADIGEIVGPVRTNFGLHIIKVTGKKKEGEDELVRASHILLKWGAIEKTRSAAQDSAEYFSFLANERGWQEAVESEKLKPQTTAFFQEGAGFIPGLGIERRASQFVFRNGKGKISDPIESEAGYVVIRIAEIEKERIRSLDEVRSSIENELKRQKRFELTGELARRARQELDNGTTFEAIAANDSLTIQRPAPFTRSGSIQGIGRDPAVIGAAFGLTRGSISQPIKGLRGYYIVRLIDKAPIDEQDYNLKKEEIRAELKTRKEQLAYTQWYTKLKQRAKIKDYRRQYNF